MNLFADSSTNHSLLACLVKGDTEEVAWPVFVEKYGQLLHNWSQRWGATSHDAEEVVQETLLKVYQNLRRYRFENGVPFRSWLKRVAYRCWLTLVRSRQNRAIENHLRDFSPEALRLLTSPSARDDLIAEFDLMATQEILEFANQKVAERVTEKSYKCYDLACHQGLNSQEISDRLDMKVSAVLMAISRVRKLLREEISQLDPPQS